jgi:hypothetical protein
MFHSQSLFFNLKLLYYISSNIFLYNLSGSFNKTETQQAKDFDIQAIKLSNECTNITILPVVGSWNLKQILIVKVMTL